MGWMIFKSSIRSGASDISDLRYDPVIQWQHRHYFPLVVLFGYLLPSAIPGLVFDDWWGGICFSGALRLTVAHHVSLFSPGNPSHYLDAKGPHRAHFASILLHTGWAQRLTMTS